ncbi:MAG: TetR/AcrR family transcriptional regulator [Proteobacteria bacterium]|nr:TetR/AcrR family transcriptional regulator [Pseudomonadota bacterium]
MGDTPRRGRGGERREEILATALRLFAQHGMAHVTTRTIARAVGISQPSLYAHFRTAAEIGDELCRRGFEVLQQRFAEVLRGGSTPGERLLALGRAYLDFAIDQPDLYRIAFMLEDPECLESGPDDVAMATGLGAFGALRAIIAELRGTDDAEGEAMAQSIWASVHGLAALLIARPLFPWVERQALIELHLGMIRDGLLARLARPAT